MKLTGVVGQVIGLLFIGLAGRVVSPQLNGHLDFGAIEVDVVVLERVNSRGSHVINVAQVHDRKCRSFVSQPDSVNKRKAIGVRELWREIVLQIIVDRDLKQLKFQKVDLEIIKTCSDQLFTISRSRNKTVLQSALDEGAAESDKQV